MVMRPERFLIQDIQPPPPRELPVLQHPVHRPRLFACRGRDIKPSGPDPASLGSYRETRSFGASCDAPTEISRRCKRQRGWVGFGWRNEDTRLRP
jgi:hypothetical protein